MSNNNPQEPGIPQSPDRLFYMDEATNDRIEDVYDQLFNYDNKESALDILRELKIYARNPTNSLLSEIFSIYEDCWFAKKGSEEPKFNAKLFGEKMSEWIEENTATGIPNPSDSSVKQEPLLDYPAAARVIALWLAEFCDETRIYPNMIAEAARRAKREIDSLRAATDDAHRTEP